MCVCVQLVRPANRRGITVNGERRYYVWDVLDEDSLINVFIVKFNFLCSRSFAFAELSIYEYEYEITTGLLSPHLSAHYCIMFIWMLVNSFISISMEFGWLVADSVRAYRLCVCVLERIGLFFFWLSWFLSNLSVYYDSFMSIWCSAINSGILRDIFTAEWFFAWWH